MNGDLRQRRGALRGVLVVLLLVAAFFAASPWLGCSWNVVKFGFDFTLVRVCTVGFPSVGLPQPSGLPGFAGPYWGNLVVGIVYVVAAVYAAVTKRVF